MYPAHPGWVIQQELKKIKSVILWFVLLENNANEWKRKKILRKKNFLQCFLGRQEIYFIFLLSKKKNIFFGCNAINRCDR